ncbi:hypothetical protein [Streptomyces sp. SID13031]|uniref:hypothetical protein n=1 Tax=Streptomyces sp. SID13031 TaxID=2706046 RepID=UPI0013C868F8|nr:hypothetical protein [Streptomyces sp. SID13031]NEA35521.1 hypothetical protein [Streptomyces sp. SID13031]
MSRFKHQQSHASLLRDVSRSSVRLTRSGLDAIVVPAARTSPPQHLIALSVAMSVPLVVLCSRRARVEQVADRVSATFGARGLIIDVPDGYPQSWTPLTSGQAFNAVSAGRSSDLSVKRNIGLRLARMRGWKKILFVDDDISQLSPRHIERLTVQLDRNPVASMASREFPDNSVVCHARRLAGFKQDVFVSGAVLGISTYHPAVSFFPDVYNEDWFFFARPAATRSLPKIGEVRQDEYKPFADPLRARHEEFGDLVAEGMYGLFESRPGWDFEDQLHAAESPRFWQRVIDNRRSFIHETERRLSNAMNRGPANSWTMTEALKSLSHAEDQLNAISSEVCVEFIASWREDDARWRAVLRSDYSGLNERDAFDELELKTWISCGYGAEKAVRRRRHISIRPELSASG